MEILAGPGFKFPASPLKSPSATFTLPLSSSLSFRTRPFCTTAAVSRRAFQDDAASSSAVEATASLDPSLLVKEKAADFSPVLKGTSLFLVGMNCSIKSNLGQLLADSLRYYYFDCDSLVQEAAGGDSSAPGRLLIDADEDDQFHEAETEVLKQLSSMGRLVVSAGNGAVHTSTNLALLRYGISVWIDVPLDMVATEVLDQLQASDSTAAGSSYDVSQVLSQVTRVYEKSKSGYASADSTISLQGLASKLGYGDVSEVKVEDIALEVLRELEKLTRVKKMMEDAARPF